MSIGRRVSGCAHNGPITFPRHMPMKTTAEVHFFFVSPAVLDACQLYSIGVTAAMQEI